MVLEDLDKPLVKMIDSPLVEGAVLAAVESVGGKSLEEISARLEAVRTTKKF